MDVGSGYSDVYLRRFAVAGHADGGGGGSGDSVDLGSAGGSESDMSDDAGQWQRCGPDGQGRADRIR